MLIVFVREVKLLAAADMIRLKNPSTNIEEMILMMKIITNIAMRLRHGSLGLVVQEVAPCPFSGALGFSFHTFL
jgi:hypothetical protein